MNTRRLKYIIILLLGLCCLSSCVTRERCLEKYPPSVTETDSTWSKDSIHIVHDTIIKPGKPVRVEVPIPCPDIYIEKEVKKNGTRAKIVVERGFVECECEADSLIQVITEMNRVKETGRSKSRSEVHTKFVKFIPWWVWFLWGLSVAAVLYIGNRFRIF